MTSLGPNGGGQAEAADDDSSTAAGLRAAKPGLPALARMPMIVRCLSGTILAVIAFAIVWALIMATSAKNDAEIAARNLITAQEDLSGRSMQAFDRMQTTVHRIVSWKAAGASEGDVEPSILEFRHDREVAGELAARLIQDWSWESAAARDQAKAILDQFFLAADNVIDLVRIDPFVVNFYLRGLEAEYAKLNAIVSAMNVEAKQREDVKSAEMAQTLRRGLEFMQALIAVMIVLSTAAGIYLARSIAKPMHAIVTTLDHLRHGRLDVEVPYADRQDEIGKVAQAVAEFRDNLRLTKSLELQREQFIHELERLAYRDGLTGLGNRTLFQRHLQRAFGQGAAGRDQPPFLILLDLDGFKEANDTLGHDAGDALLKHVATRLQRIVRPGDGLYRLGGDEFAVVVEHVGDPGSIVAVAERILEAIREPCRVPQGIVTVSASIGIADGSNLADDTSDVLRHADLALYRVKAAGKNGYRFYDESMNAAAQRRRIIELDLSQAIARGEFTLHYQPQFALDGGQLVGLEALVRWQHPTQGPIPPAELIAIAERSGQIEEIDSWVLDQAVAQLDSWRGQGLAVVPVAVNVSGSQLKSPAFLDLALTLAERSRSSGGITLEITEAGFAGPDAPLLIEALTKLHDAGYRVSLDDFGVGCSSLRSLAWMPLDELKIDRSFLLGIERSIEARSLVKGIVVLGHNLDMRLVADGVEDEAQRAILKELGCDRAQGFLFAPAEPPEQARRWLS